MRILSSARHRTTVPLSSSSRMFFKINVEPSSTTSSPESENLRILPFPLIKHVPLNVMVLVRDNFAFNSREPFNPWNKIGLSHVRSFVLKIKSLPAKLIVPGPATEAFAPNLSERERIKVPLFNVIALSIFPSKSQVNSVESLANTIGPVRLPLPATLLTEPLIAKASGNEPLDKKSDVLPNKS